MYQSIKMSYYPPPSSDNKTMIIFVLLLCCCCLLALAGGAYYYYKNKKPTFDQKYTNKYVNAVKLIQVNGTSETGPITLDEAKTMCLDQSDCKGILRKWEDTPDNQEAGYVNGKRPTQFFSNSSPTFTTNPDWNVYM